MTSQLATTIRGVSVAEQAKYQFRSLPLYVEGEMAYVYAPDYRYRMYLYEPNGLSFGQTALLYGNGIRAYLACGYSPCRCLNLFVRGTYGTHTLCEFQLQFKN